MAVTARANTQITSVTITGLSIYAGSTGSQGAEVSFTPAMPGVEGCTYPAGNVFWIDFASASQPDGKSLYATVLAAYLAGHSLTFGVLGCAESGQLPLVYRVDVGP
jgi:hypothetical protein